MKRNGHSARETSAFPPRWQQEWDWAYSKQIYPKLAKKYPNRWIAIAHRRVLASGRDVMKVLAQAHRKIDWPEIPVVFVERGIHVYAMHDR